MPHPGLTTTTWAAPRGYARPDRPAADALVIPQATELELAFTEIDDDGLLVFDQAPARAADDGGVVVTGIGTDGVPYVNPDGVTPGEEADISYDGEFLVFTPRGA